MHSSEEDNSGCDTPNLLKFIEATTQEIIPVLSKERYDKKYSDFKAWLKRRNSPSISESILMTFFLELSQKHKPTTLWAYYSMLKSTLRANDNVDIGSYRNVLGFLKSTASGYEPVQASVFSEQDITKFMNHAPDELWLDAKVICIFAVSGACNTYELPQIKLKDVENHGDVLLVRIGKTKTKPERSFTITGTIRKIVQKYADLRPPNLQEDRFFLNYQRGKCTRQLIGKNKFGQMPRRIAKFLELPNPESFTGNSFRRTSQSFQKTSSNILMYGSISLPSNPVTVINNSTQRQQQMGIPVTNSIASSSSIFSAVSETYNTCTTSNGSKQYPNAKTDPLSHTNDPNQQISKFGEIYCNSMGVLSYHCTLCPAQMDHSEDFSLHYMTHFSDVFPVKQEAQMDQNDFEYRITNVVEPIYPISIVKLEEPQIKSEPADSEDDEMSTEYSFGEIESNTIV